uniref:Monocarboxylate transporter 5 n=2 Tax=Cacopsylla melanoneura TaxID=428564 RepID=A0A8D8TLC5_9HEMI
MSIVKDSASLPTSPELHNLKNNYEKKDNQKKEEVILVPPDGGWGWLVLLGSLLVNVLMPGTIKSFGVLFVEFIEVFNASQVTASWIPAVCYFLYSSLGPLASYLSAKYSYRTVTLIGGTFASIGMVASFYADSIFFLYISYGVFVGIGAGLSFPPGIFIVTSYFLKYRGLANGIAISGSALGSIFLPPFLRYLLETYGYRGAVLIMGGITLNVWVGAMLYQPVSWHMKKVVVYKTSTSLEDIEEAKDSPEEMMTFSPTDKYSNSYHNSNSTLPQLGSAAHLTPYRKLSNINKPVFPIGSTGHLNSHKTLSPNEPNERKISFVSTSSLRYVSTAFHGSTLVGLNIEETKKRTKNKRKNEKEQMYATANNKNRRLESESPLKQLIRDPVFIILLISNGTTAIGYTNFTIFLPSYAFTLGYDKSISSYLLSIVAAFDLIGRVGGSSLSDWLTLDKKYYYIGGLLVSGIVLAVLPFATTYTSLAIHCGLFGLSSGIFIGITAVTMVDLLGEDKLTASYGISLFVNGLLQLIGPPLCGVTYEYLHSYKPIFTCLGLFLIAGASVWVYLPLSKIETKKAIPR